MIFRFLITLFLFYLAFRLLFRLISGSSSSPHVFTFGYSPREREREEGEVTVHMNRTSKPKKDNNEGEYVDFEEVK